MYERHLALNASEVLVLTQRRVILIQQRPTRTFNKLVWSHDRTGADALTLDLVGFVIRSHAEAIVQFKTAEVHLTVGTCTPHSR